MNTKFLITTSATTLAASGVMLIFMPEEIISIFNWENNKSFELLLQVLGALYFAFAMLNWMTKSSAIGGIYNRPIATANFSHFIIAALALFKGLMTDPGLPYLLWSIAIIYFLFAISFAALLFLQPTAK